MKTSRFKKLHGERAWQLLVKPLMDNFNISEEDANQKIHGRIIDLLFVLEIENVKGLIQIKKEIRGFRKTLRQKKAIERHL